MKSPLDNLWHGGLEYIYPEDRGVGNSIEISIETSKKLHWTNPKQNNIDVYFDLNLRCTQTAMKCFFMYLRARVAKKLLWLSPKKQLVDFYSD